MPRRGAESAGVAGAAAGIARRHQPRGHRGRAVARRPDGTDGHGPDGHRTDGGGVVPLENDGGGRRIRPPADARRRRRRWPRRPRCRNGTAGATTRPTRASSPAAAARAHRADGAEAHLEMGVRLPGVTACAAQPTVVRGPRVRRQRAGTGLCARRDHAAASHWTFKADAGVRTAVIVGRLAGSRAPRYAVYFGDLSADVYARGRRHRRRSCGRTRWTITRGPASPAAPTCSTDGCTCRCRRSRSCPARAPSIPAAPSAAASSRIDAATGKQIWKTFTIPEAPADRRQERAGTPLWKPAGAAIWTSPTIDAARNAVLRRHRQRLHRAGGRRPATRWWRSIVDTGAIQWVSAGDAERRVRHRLQAGNDNCPDDAGPDFDFGNSPILRTLGGGRRILVIGQKSGVAWGLDPDNNGAVVWQIRVGQGGALGGIEWGSAADEQIDVRAGLGRARPGEGRRRPDALSLGTGEKLWHTPPPRADVQRRPRLHRRAVGRHHRDSRRGLLGGDRRPHARLLDRPTARSSGTSTRCASSRR